MVFARKFVRRLNFLVATVMFSVFSVSSSASIISVTPSASQVNVGDSFSVFFNISGLSSNAGDSLSGFDLSILYDPAVATFSGFSFNDPSSAINQLDLAELGAFPFAGDATAAGGVIDAFAISGNSPAILDSDQANAFQFLALSFMALAPSAGALISIDLNDPNLLFVDSGSGILPASFQSARASVSIVPSAQNLPEPATWILLAVGFVALTSLRQRQLTRT